MITKIPKPLYVSSQPTPPGIPNPTCPILLEAKVVFDKAENLHRAIRNLRCSTQRCFTCPEKAECISLHHIAHAFDAAIRDLRQEWGLDQE